MKILVVEDDVSVRETMGLVLESLQHEADLLPDGDNILTYLEKIWPDILLLDLNLPGASGEEIYQKIEAKFGKAPPTIVFSALQEGQKRINYFNLGNKLQNRNVQFLAKPYTIEQLSDLLDTTFKKFSKKIAA